MSQISTKNIRKPPVFLPHTGPRVSFIFSLANFVKIPLFFTRKLVLNVPAVSARHPIWRLSVDGLAASGLCRAGGPSLVFRQSLNSEGTRDRLGLETSQPSQNENDTLALFACFIPHQSLSIMSSTIKESKRLKHVSLTWTKTRLRLIELQSCSPFFLLSALSQNLSFCRRWHFDICHFGISSVLTLSSHVSLSLWPELHHDWCVVTPGRARAARDPRGWHQPMLRLWAEKAAAVSEETGRGSN